MLTMFHVLCYMLYILILYNIPMVNTTIYLFAAAILVTDIGIVLYVALLGSDFFFKTSYLKPVKKILSPHAYYLLFFNTLLATLGSLFLSDIAKIPPCIFCWYQRIALYPQVVLIYITIVREETIKPYLLSLNIIGAGIAVYHIIIQRIPSASILNCDATGVSCTKIPFEFFGYITIPVMSLTVFLVNIIILSFSRKAK